MSKISCNVIQDIMPLYVDEIVSEDTKKLVEEHLKECEDCRKEMEKMRAKIILPNKKKINQAEKELFQKLKHRLINRRIAAAILGAILVCALLAGVYTILVLPKEPIPFDPQKMEVEIVGEDAYLSYAGSDSAGSVFCNPVTVGEGAEKREIAMVYLNRNLWSTYIQPHLQEQNEDEMIYLGKAADMDIIYYGKFDVENFYEKIPEILKEMTHIWNK